MFHLSRTRSVLFKIFILSPRYCTNPANESVLINNKIQFFTKILELPDSDATQKLMKKKKGNDHLLTLNEGDVENSLTFLKNIGVTVEDVRKQPTILMHKEITLRNRYELLHECGCLNVNATHLHGYVKLLNQTEEFMKKNQIIPFHIDVPKRLAKILNVKLLPNRRPGRPRATFLKVSKSLKTIREDILKLFYEQNRIATTEEYDRLIKHYPNGKNKSYRNTKEMVQLLDEIKLPKDEIKYNFFIMSGDPDNIRKLLTMKPIDGIEMEEILRNNPKILMQSHDSLQKVITHIKDFGITETSIAKCLRVLTLAPDTVYERLIDINSIRELQVMKDHPNILSVVFHKTLSDARMNYLQLLNMKCYSLGILTCSTAFFERYTRQGADKTSTNSCIDFLVKTFNKDMFKIKEEISRHLYWLHIPIVDMKQTIEYLRNIGFHLEDIYSNIHIVLYSSDVIISRLKTLIETGQAEGLSNSSQLKMVLYSIELDHNFSGEGVWAERITSDRLTSPNFSIHHDTRTRFRFERIFHRATKLNR